MGCQGERPVRGHLCNTALIVSLSRSLRYYCHFWCGEGIIPDLWVFPVKP